MHAGRQQDVLGTGYWTLCSSRGPGIWMGRMGAWAGGEARRVCVRAQGDDERVGFLRRLAPRSWEGCLTHWTPVEGYWTMGGCVCAGRMEACVPAGLMREAGGECTLPAVAGQYDADAQPMGCQRFASLCFCPTPIQPPKVIRIPPPPSPAITVSLSPSLSPGPPVLVRTTLSTRRRSSNEGRAYFTACGALWCVCGGMAYVPCGVILVMGQRL